MKKPLLKPLFLVLTFLTLNLVLAVSVDLDQLDIAKFTLSPDTEKTLQFNQEEYILKAESVTDSELKLSFSPNNLAVTAKKEKPVEIDLDNDKEPDFSLTYLSILDQTATLEVKKIGIPNEEAEEDKGFEIPKPKIPEIGSILTTLKANLKIPIIILVVIIILIILVKSYKKRASPERFYRKAEVLHREAQEFHEDGDEETAQELYDKAEEMREKARELENQEV